MGSRKFAAYVKYLIPSNLKQFSIGQCITQDSRSRSGIFPVTLGFCIVLKKRFGTKWLVEQLQRLGNSMYATHLMASDALQTSCS